MPWTVSTMMQRTAISSSTSMRPSSARMAADRLSAATAAGGQAEGAGLVVRRAPGGSAGIWPHRHGGRGCGTAVGPPQTKRLEHIGYL
jgi:hypothetical protein